MRLFKKLVFMLLAVGCLPLGIAGWFLLRTNAEALRTSIFERQREQASSLARTVDLELEHIAGALEGYVGQNDVGAMSDAQRDEQVRRILGRWREDLNIVSLWHEGTPSPVAIAFFRATAAGQVVAPDGMTAGHLSSVAKTRPDPMAPVFSDAYLNGSGESCVTLLIPARPGTTGAYTLAAEVRLARIQDEVASIRVGPGGDAFVVDRRGRVVASRNPELVRTRADRSSNELVMLAAGGQLSGTRDYRNAEGTAVLGAYAPAHALGWIAIVEEPANVALAPATRMLRQTIGIGGVTMIAAILAGVLFARGLSQPLQKVVGASLSIARGRFGARVLVERRDEIGELAHTFNYMSQQLAGYDADNKRLYLELQQGYLETIRALANSIDAKDPYTRGHSQRVTEYAVDIARELSLGEEEISRIQFGGILHDIGKIGIKEKVLGKSAPLTDEEYEYMKTHPLLGVGIVDPIEFLDPIKPIIRQHHERWDGKGYPDGLKGEDIDIGARIVNVADSWDAMVTQRPYNTPMTHEQGLQRLRQIAGSQHDPRVTEAFLAVLSRRRAEELAGDAWRLEQSGQESNVVELPKRRE